MGQAAFEITFFTGVIPDNFAIAIENVDADGTFEAFFQVSANTPNSPLS